MTDAIEEVWPQIVEAFQVYGRDLSRVCGASRREIISKRLSDGYMVSDLVAAVHGYVAFHEGLDPKPGHDFNPRKWFDPESVFKATRFDTRVELGQAGQWVFVSEQEKHDRAVKAKQAAARKKFDEARAAENQKDRLRIVGED